jgi:hypothetical protein
VSAESSTVNDRPLALTGLLSASIAAVSVTALVMTWGVIAVFSSAFNGIDQGHDPATELASLISEHDAAMTMARDRFNGRSPFFPPSHPQREREEQKEVIEFKQPTPTVVPEPSIYVGPTPIYAIGDTVWFQPPRPGDPQLVLSVGQSVADNLTVISTDLPWSIKVRWSGKEFDLKLFENNGEPFLLKRAPSWPTHPGVMPKYDDPFMTPSDLANPPSYRPRDVFEGGAA